MCVANLQLNELMCSKPAAEGADMCSRPAAEGADVCSKPAAEGTDMYQSCS